MTRTPGWALLLLAVATLPWACGVPVLPGSRQESASPGSTDLASPARGIDRSPRQARIIEPTPGWPRKVRDANGPITIVAKPARIHTLSVGFDEITFRLVDPSRIVAVGRSTTNPELSNVADLARQIPRQVGRDAEEIVALEPDLVVASPFASADLIAQLRAARITVVVADLVGSVDGEEENIRLLAYLYGEEERGETLIQELRGQIDRITTALAKEPSQTKPRVLLLEGSFTAGRGTTEDGILNLAGATNAAAAAGIVGSREISAEGLVVIDPDIIVLADPQPSGPSLSDPLLQQPGVQGLRALQERRIVRIKWSLVSTLSHWNVIGAEQLARAFHPSAFS